MRPSDEKVAVIETWMRNAFPEAQVSSDGDFTTESHLFWARPAGSNGFELVVSYEAFEDHPVDRLVAALESLNAVEQLREGRPLMLNRFLRLVPAPVRHAAGGR